MQDAFEQFVHARGAGLLRLAYLLCEDPRQANKLVQEVLARASRDWKHIETGHPDSQLKQQLIHTHLSWWQRNRPAKLKRTAIVLAHLDGPYDAAELMGISDEKLASLIAGSHEDLDAQAEFAPVPYNLLAGVRQVTARTKRRRLTAVLVTLALLGSAAAAYQIKNREPAAEPSVEAIESAEPETSALGAAGDYAKGLPSFPYELGYVPAGVTGLEPEQLDDQLRLSNERVTLSVAQREISWVWPMSAQVVAGSVNGAEAKLAKGKVGSRDAFGLRWQRDGHWLTLSTLELSQEDTQRIAESLKPASKPIVPRFRFTLLPPKHKLVAISPSRTCFDPVTVAVSNGPLLSLCATLASYAGRILPRFSGERTLVGGHEAYFLASAGLSLTVLISDQLVLAVNALPYSIRTEQDLRDLTEGITVTT